MSSFTIYPAVDIRRGRCVRLLQGRADQETVYGRDPIEMARHWVEQGAKFLHVVDLDGAFSGASEQYALIQQIAQAIDIPVQAGGGLRSDEDVERLLNAGVARVVLGTRAWAEPEKVRALIQKHGDKIAVGIDARGGWVQVRGWTETTSVRAVDFARQAEALGVKTLISTDTATDGMLKGTNAQAVDEICMAVQCNVIASGGVASAADVKELNGLRRKNLTGAIVGKALYEGRATLAELAGAAAP